MHSRIGTGAFRGIETTDAEIQAQITNGLPSRAIVGRAYKSVAEFKDRLRVNFTVPAAVARTIANLAHAKQVGREEVAEALAYRMIPLPA